MINFKKVERITAAIEQQLGIEASDNDEFLVEEIDKNIADEKKDLGVDDNPHNESPLQADDESEGDNIENEIADAEFDNPTNIEQTMDDEDFGPGEVQACVASLKRLIKIAKAVKMSKDIPATKKEEVLSKIQKASAKFRKAAAQGEGEEGDSKGATDHPAVQTFISIFNQKRGKLNNIMKGKGQGAIRIRSLLGDVDNKMVGNMTLTELFETMSSILGKLK